MAQYTRVKDRTTGHEYDVLTENVDPKLHTLVDKKRYPPTSRPRRPKHSVNYKPERQADDTADGQA